MVGQRKTGVSIYELIKSCTFAKLSKNTQRVHARHQLSGAGPTCLRAGRRAFSSKGPTGNDLDAVVANHVSGSVAAPPAATLANSTLRTVRNPYAVVANPYVAHSAVSALSKTSAAATAPAAAAVRAFPPPPIEQARRWCDDDVYDDVYDNYVADDYDPDNCCDPDDYDEHKQGYCAPAYSAAAASSSSSFSS